MTIEAQTLEGVISHVDIEALLRVDELPDGGVVVSRSCLVEDSNPRYRSAIDLADQLGATRLLRTDKFYRYLNPETPFAGDYSIVEFWA